MLNMFGRLYAPYASNRTGTNEMAMRRIWTLSS
jgi:hypothetical protein